MTPRTSVVLTAIWLVLTLNIVTLAKSVDEAEGVCEEGACGPREVSLPHDEDETEDKNKEPNINLLGIEKGLFGSIVAFEDKDRNQKLLLSERFGVGGHYLDKQTHASFVSHSIMEAIKFVHPKPKEGLIIGTMGAGHFVRLLQAKMAKSVVLEYDFQMGAQAKKHFNVEPTHVYNGDPMDHIKSKFVEKQFDWIIHDAFSTGNNPVHLLTRYNLKSMKRLLCDNGVMTIKWYGHMQGRYMHYIDDVIKTLKGVFVHVRVFADRKISWHNASPFAHLVIFASDSPIEFTFPEAVATAKDAEKGRPVWAWQQMSAWEYKITENDFDKAVVITEKDNPLVKWWKKTTRDFKADMRHKMPLRVWNLAVDYLKLTRDNPLEDDDEND